MALNKIRLDRFISQQGNISRGDVRLLLAQQRVLVDGDVATDIGQIIDAFSHVQLDAQVLQANQPSYFMLHKPVGVVSATKDDKHKTVIDLLTCAERHSLHIVGRLDLNSSGLILLTNDSRWSARLTLPAQKVSKRYLVTLQQPLTQDYISAFAQGMYFGYENITTLPATLKIISLHVAQVTLVEGRYHQIKRMFGRFRNPVIALHRQSIGNLSLDETLPIGASRALTPQQVIDIVN
jgi:16S rRNA pseudouridine516 synthase